MDPFIPNLQHSVGRFSTAVRTGPLDAAVRGCPGWDLAELTRHIGFIHRWARLAVVTGGRPDTTLIDEAPDPAGTGGPGQLADWFDAGAAALVDALAGLDPDGPTWHPFPVALVGRVWPRRQAHEAFVHAWDAEEAIGADGPMDPTMAADGIAEYFEVIVPRIITRDQRPAPIGTLAVVCTDVAFAHGSNRLLVRAAEPLVVVSSVTGDEEHPPDGELVGTAEELSLALWGRRPLPTRPADPLALEWLRYGGN